MKKAQHTPGPWRVGKCYSQSKRGTIERPVVLTVAGNYFIAEQIRGETTDPVELQANARLIAAAPELLEACEKALAGLSAWVDDYPYGVPQEDRDLLNQLRAAIVKARGEEAGL